MESAISLGVLTGVSWGATKYHEKRIAAKDKKERREQRHHQAETQRHKLRADFEREKREIAEREHRKARKQLEATRLQYHDTFAQQLVCADSGGYVTCLQPAALTLDPASNGSSSVLDAAGGVLGFSTTTYIIALLLTLLVAAIWFLVFITDQLRQHCKKELAAKDENFEQLNLDLTTITLSLEDAKQQLFDSEQHQQASATHAEQLEKDLAEMHMSLEDTNGQLDASEKKLHESVAHAKTLQSDLDKVKKSLETVEGELRTSQEKQKDSASHAERLENDLANQTTSLEVTKGQLVDSEKRLADEASRAKQFEIDLAAAKNSLQSETRLLQQAESDRQMHKTNSELRQKQVEESGAVIKDLHAQLTSLREVSNRYKLANEQSTTDKQQLETSLAEVKDSLDYINQELGRVTTELRNAKQKHNDHEMLTRRVLAKCGEHARDAREAHLIVKYGLLWQLRVRTKTSVPVAATATDVLHGQEENDESDAEYEDGAENPPTPDVNGPEERNGEGENKADEEAGTAGGEKTGEEAQFDEQDNSEEEQKETFAQETSTEEGASTSKDDERTAVKGGQDRPRRQRGMNPNKRKRLIEEGKIPAFRDPEWIDPATGLPSRGMPPEYLREWWAAERARLEKEGILKKAKPAETQQNMLPTAAPQPPPGAPTAPRAIANGFQGPQPPTEPKAMRKDTHEQDSNPKGGFLPPHLKDKQMVNKPMPTVQPDAFDWTNQSLA